MYGMHEKENLIPSEVAQLQLARTIDEKCKILKSLGAKYFKCLELYEGAACLKAWQEKRRESLGRWSRRGTKMSSAKWLQSKPIFFLSGRKKTDPRPRASECQRIVTWKFW